MKTRAPRRKVLLRARIRAGAQWQDACILNLTRGGLGLQAARPPAPGAYVEVESEGRSTVGQVTWSSQRRFGVKTRDAWLFAPKDEAALPLAAAARRASAARAPVAHRRIEFSLVAIGAAAGVLMLAYGAHHTLSKGLDPVRDALSAPGPSES